MNYNNFYYSYYNYINDHRNYYPEVSRLPYSYLIYISNTAHKRINPGVYEPDRNFGYYCINCYAKFKCLKCSKNWTSNLGKIELWWKYRKT